MAQLHVVLDEKHPVPGTVSESEHVAEGVGLRRCPS